MAFASSHQNDGENSQFLPWLLRFLFVGGTIGVIAFVLVQHEERLHERLTPDQQEFKDWWGTFLAVMSGGFATGLVVRVILGRTNHLFEALRAWLSVVGMVMLALEIALIIVFFKSENKQDDFLRYWQACELAIVSAYFGTRA